MVVAPQPYTLPRQVPIFRVGDGSPVAGDLREMTPEDKAAIDGSWPALLQAMDPRPVDAKWKWGTKTSEEADALKARIGVEAVVIDAAGQIEGAMITTLPAQAVSTLSRLGKLPVYVEYLVTAPWNRPEATTRKLKGVGGQLLLHAVRRSLELGRGGRLALHSADERSTFFYADPKAKVRLPKLGPDPDEGGMEYFEGDEAWASGFIAGR